MSGRGHGLGVLLVLRGDALLYKAKPGRSDGFSVLVILVAVRMLAAAWSP